MIEASREDERLVDQRLRNRLIEQLESFAEGRAHLYDVGYAEYFESFFDFAPYEGEMPSNAATTISERQAVAVFLALAQEACATTPGKMPEADFARTGWPDRLAVAAGQCLEAFAARGRLSEDSLDLT